MSMMQTFRDGPRYQPGAYRELWKGIWRVLLSILTCALMVIAIVNFAMGDVQRATFDAVIVLWLLRSEK